MNIFRRYAISDLGTAVAGRGSGRFPREADPRDRAVAGRRQHRHARAHRRSAIDHDTGQTVVVDNRAGAAGTIGVDMVAKAIPDGYTITMVEGAHVILPATTARMPYDLARDFMPLTLIGVSPQICS